MEVAITCESKNFRYFKEYLIGLRDLLRDAGHAVRMLQFATGHELAKRLAVDTEDVIFFTNFIPSVFLKASGRDHRRICIMEQMSSSRNLGILGHLRHTHIAIDYSSANVEYAKVGSIVHYPLCDDEIGRLSALCAVDKEFDVVMVVPGPSARRQRIVQAFAGSGLRFSIASGFGTGRDEAIAKAKILLNVHFYDDYSIFESVRCDRWVAAGMIVVSETSDVDVGNALTDHVVFTPFADIVRTVRSTLADYDAIKARWDDERPRVLARARRRRAGELDAVMEEVRTRSALSEAEITAVEESSCYASEFGHVGVDELRDFGISKARETCMRCGCSDTATFPPIDARQHVLTFRTDLRRKPEALDMIRVHRTLDRVLEAWSDVHTGVMANVVDESVHHTDYVFRWAPIRDVRVWGQVDGRVATLNTRVDWGSMCVRTCMLHCVGHWLGLPHVSDATSILHPLYFGDRPDVDPVTRSHVPDTSSRRHVVHVMCKDGEGNMVEGDDHVGERARGAPLVAQIGIYTPEDLSGVDILYQVRDGTGTWQPASFSGTLTSMRGRVTGFRATLAGEHCGKYRIFYRVHARNGGDRVGANGMVLDAEQGIEQLQVVVADFVPRLAYVTCATGIDGPNLQVPRRPNLNEEALYFSDNAGMRRLAEAEGWTFCGLPGISGPTEDAVASTMRSKAPKITPLRMPTIRDAGFRFVVWGDTKYDINEYTVRRCVERVASGRSNASLTLARHRFLRGGPRREVEEALLQQRYKRQAFKMRDYLEELGGAAESIYHYECGFLFWNLGSAKCEEVQEAWFAAIEKAGIDDQISMPAIKDEFPDEVALLNGWMGGFGEHSTFSRGMYK